MTASADTRAKRRYKELLEKGHNLSYEDVLENVISRDHIDSTRDDSPLVKAKDAIEFDNSTLTIEEQLASIRDLVKQKLKA
jgi:cytidylate kinase